MAEVHELGLPLEDLMAQLLARLDSIRAWLMALTGLSAAQLLALVAMTLMLARG
jgi:hypothetical protein